MSPFNSSDEVRGEQYLAQLQEVMAISGAKKSQRDWPFAWSPCGALCRKCPDQVGSVLTFGGANQGTVVASDVMKFADQTGSSDLLNVLISSFGKVIM